MTYTEFYLLNKIKELETVSADNHIFHYVLSNGKKLEIDEDLESNQIKITEVE